MLLLFLMRALGSPTASRHSALMKLVTWIKAFQVITIHLINNYATKLTTRSYSFICHQTTIKSFCFAFVFDFNLINFPFQNCNEMKKKKKKMEASSIFHMNNEYIQYFLTKLTSVGKLCMWALTLFFRISPDKDLIKNFD